jgi:O6-methylguanine-DNA--protein-cysteine methyltransferase
VGRDAAGDRSRHQPEAVRRGLRASLDGTSAAVAAQRTVQAALEQVPRGRAQADAAAAATAFAATAAVATAIAIAAAHRQQAVALRAAATVVALEAHVYGSRRQCSRHRRLLDALSPRAVDSCSRKNPLHVVDFQ